MMTFAHKTRHDHRQCPGRALSTSLRDVCTDPEPLGGPVALPLKLRDALTDVCPHCGHEQLQWHGPLPELIQALDKATAVVSGADAAFTVLRVSIAPHLENVKVAV